MNAHNPYFCEHVNAFHFGVRRSSFPVEEKQFENAEASERPEQPCECS